MDEKTSITNVEIMRNDMSYMKNDLAEIKATLKIVLEKYVHREEMVSRFDRVQVEMDKRFTALYDRQDQKADVKDFDKINAKIETKCDKEDFNKMMDTMTWLNRIVLGTVVGAILAVIIGYTQ